MKTIKTVGVIGAGTMGSALAQKFAQQGFAVILVDREMTFVNRGFAGIKETLNQGIERKIFTEEQVAEILNRIRGTDNLQDLQNCDLVVEAIFEDFTAKRELYQKISNILPPETIIATNTSSFSVTELAESVRHPQRFIGMHYFYHAAKNRLVEIIPGSQTAPETVRSCEAFAFLTGKDPIFCKDRYGFAVNRVFVPWLNEAVRLQEEGIAAATIDHICMKTFGIGMGPFALMNATGVPIAYHAQKTLEGFGNLYRVAAQLEKQAKSGEPWTIAEAPPDSVDRATEKIVSERMLGTVFLVCSQILDEKICTATELNRGARIGLRWRRGPIELMQHFGEAEVERLIKRIVERYSMQMPQSIGRPFWKLEFVNLRKQNHAAIITVSRPEDLNALNETVIRQLSEKFAEALEDNAVQEIFLTGSGKAFVAGADIKFFVTNIRQGNINNIVEFTRWSQQIFAQIDDSPKKVTAIVNGLALGGGLELALCADEILALPGAQLAFPETGLGIFPGLGGTWRTTRRIGKGLTKYLVFTGHMLSARDAESLGLIDAVVQPEEFLALTLEGKLMPRKKKLSAAVGRKWETIRELFDRYTLQEILVKPSLQCSLTSEELEKIRAIIKRKAPIALRTAEKLIDERRGPEAELEAIAPIFATRDALMGLTSIGKRVEFQGK